MLPSTLSATYIPGFVILTRPPTRLTFQTGGGNTPTPLALARHHHQRPPMRPSAKRITGLSKAAVKHSFRHSVRSIGVLKAGQQHQRKEEVSAKRQACIQDLLPVVAEMSSEDRDAPAPTRLTLQTGGDNTPRPLLLPATTNDIHPHCTDTVLIFVGLFATSVRQLFSLDRSSSQLRNENFHCIR
ncbi:hypothetical protein CY34DRAFT_18454 [Suillus luteus UH-Slu-Lm8-n1]|uniref:Uncharacterized protein n=1 Tax=Suillus luteus UH-Slu-Lm8-n1 TaxID=930992 RepID=A0A0D0A502_9AGAM|nr:hypothetical protein CY34DRAFT_18454 [Suillus luteus UH-Slu-Lm8-n1]